MGSILELQSIVVASKISNQPVTNQILWTDNQVYELAAIDHWIMTKKIFVIQWQWLMLKCRVGLRHIPLVKFNQDLLKFNLHTDVVLKNNQINLMTKINEYILKKYNDVSLDEQYSMFERALIGWNPDLKVDDELFNAIVKS